MVRRVLAFVASSIVLLSPGCGAHGDDSPSDPETRARPQARAEAPAAPRPLFGRNRQIMGTVFSIQVDAPEEVAEPAIAAAFDEIARLEEVLSEWRPSSEISRINAAAGEHPVAIGTDTLEVVRAGLETSRESGGAFDLSWAALRGLYDFGPGSHDDPDPREIRRRIRLIGYRDIVLDEAAGTVFLRRRGMQIGTGGIAKGYALDRAGSILEAAGIRSYMLFGGGQVQIHGMRGDRPWRVGIQHPREPEEYFAFLEASDVSISTSGDYEHSYFDDAGVRIHHIIDTRTGLPARGALSVTVITRDGIHADALSTAVFVLGVERGLALLAALPFHAEAVIVGPDCVLHATPGTADRLRFRMPPDANGVLPRCVGRP